MVTVPKTVKLRTIPDQTPYQNINAPIGAFGGTSAAALSKLGSDIDRASSNIANIAMTLQKDKNDTDFNEARLEYDRNVDELLYTENGLFAKNGKDFINEAPAVSKSIRELRTQITGKYNSNVQRRLNESLGQRELHYSRSIAEKSLSARKAYAQTLSDARKQQYINDSARAYNDDEVILKSAAGLDVVISSDIDRLGLEGDVANRYADQQRTVFYKQLIESALNSNDTGRAKELFDKYSSKMDGAVASEVKDKLLGASVLAEAQAEADRIMAMNVPAQDRLKEARKYKDPSVRAKLVNMVQERNIEVTLKSAQALSDSVSAKTYLTAEEMREQIREEPDARIRAEALSILNTRLNNQAADVKTARANAVREAAKFIQSGGTLNDFATLKPDAYRSILGDTEAYNRLKKTENTIAEGKIYSEISDGKTEFSLLSMNREQLAALSDEDLTTYRASLTQSEWNRVKSAVIAAKSEINEAGENAELFRRSDQILKQNAPINFGWFDDDPDDDQVINMRVARNVMHSRIQEIIDSKRIPNEADMSDIAQELYVPVEMQDTLLGFTGILPGKYQIYTFTKDGFAFNLDKLPKEERENFTVNIDDLKDDRPEVVQDMVTKLNQLGITDPSDTFLSNMFGAQLMRDRNRQLELIEQERQKLKK